MTSLQTAIEPRVPVLQTALPANAPDNDFDRSGRWAEWLAKGRVHDDQMRRRMAWFVALMGVALASLSIWALTS
jgi:hypothetical protein